MNPIEASRNIVVPNVRSRPAESLQISLISGSEETGNRPAEWNCHSPAATARTARKTTKQPTAISRPRLDTPLFIGSPPCGPTMYPPGGAVGYP
ncbi:hypothetical protein FMUAM8_01360 [Nocardia cyriacigeorgica]|nr:hypothetical protein FMUAM8_01360 [Nocardia cyriacigeorgica]